jgi:K+-transporting ATPase c subunit
VIAAHTDGCALGFMGEPSVNELAVNIVLDEQHPGG